jgi:hypothetical protein
MNTDPSIAARDAGDGAQPAQWEFQTVPVD